MNDINDIDALAAEYVLGTLDGNERAQVQAKLAADQALAAKVRIWERRLSELHLMVEPIEPDGEIWERINAKVPPPPPGLDIPVSPPLPDQTPVPTITDKFAVPPSPEKPIAPVVVDKPKTAPAPELPRAPMLEPVKSIEPASSIARTEGPPSAERLLEAAESIATGKSSEAAETKPNTNREDAAKITERTAERVERAPEGVAKADIAVKADKPKTDEPAPGSDMTEPTPAGPLSSFPSSFSGAAPAQAPLTPSPAPAAAQQVPPPPPVAPPSPAVVVRPERRRAVPAAPPKRRFARTIGWVATLMLIAILALVGAWRFAPDRVPAALQPMPVLRALGIVLPTTVGGPPPRRPAPPESQYDE